jgi:LuxR family maltose regulon positive regulatory protein
VTNAAELLAKLEHENMFLLRLGDDRAWYRFHQLFADFLQSTVPPDEQRELHLEASRWFAANGLLEDAIKHALAARDYPAVVPLLRAQIDTSLSRGQLPTLAGWLDSMPAAILKGNGDLAGYKAWLLYLQGKTSQAPAYAALGDAVAQNSAPAADLGRLLAFRSYLALNWGEPKEAVAFAQSALAHLKDTESFFQPYALVLMGQALALQKSHRQAAETLRDAIQRSTNLGNLLMEVDGRGHLAEVLYMQGQLREAKLICLDGLKLSLDPSGAESPTAGLVHIPMGTLLYESNDLVEAERHLIVGGKLCEELHMVSYRVAGKCTLAKLYWVLGKRDTAWQTLAEAQRVSEHPECPRRQRLVAAMTAELHAREGNLDAASRTLHMAAHLPGVASEHELLVQARVLLAEGNPGAAWKLLSLLEEQAEGEQSYGVLIAINIVQSQCKAALGQHAGAHERLESAVSYAATEQYVRSFVDDAPVLVEMLEKTKSVAPEFVASILAQMGPDDSSRAQPPAKPLSEQEVKILALMNRGLTNREIAERLQMTLGNTKWWTSQIFGKLRARNRVEALAIARRLRLL